MPDFDFSAHDKKEVVGVIREMRQEMKRAGGVGLSGNQVGLDWRLFVAEIEDEFYAIFNPKITKTSITVEELEEGCLSLPEIYVPVDRPIRVTLEGQDQNGKKLKIKAGTPLSRVFQHETDHLNGKLITDHKSQA